VASDVPPLNVIPREETSAMSTPASPASPAPIDPSIDSLAKELGWAQARHRRSLERDWGLDPVEADRRARGLEIEDFPGYLAHQQGRPPEELTWDDLATISEHDPVAALDAWRRVQEVADQELQRGERTAAALSGGRKAIDRAQFLAVRKSFTKDYNPRGAIEAALVDALAEHFSSYLSWTEEARRLGNGHITREAFRETQDGYQLPPTMSVAKAHDRAMAHADRAYQRFLKTEKALRDRRRLPPVYMVSADRVTIGGQHVHAERTTGGSGAPEFPPADDHVLEIAP